MKKRLIFGVLSLLTASLLISQSVVDASKKEQECREKLKGKSVRVVTNADLKAKDKPPAVGVGAREAVKAQPQGQTESGQEQGAAAEAEAQPEQPQEEPEYSPSYAASVYPDWFLVENPELAVGPPDGRYAEISVTGVLDLDIEVNNGPGDDLAIYARAPAKTLPEWESGDQLDTDQAAMWWGDFRYAVLGLDTRGEWQEIGLGSGQNPDNFDIGALKSTARIRIMFKTYSNPVNQGDKPMRLAGKELTFGLDAVGALH
jgi:hypothetical protein